MGRCQSKQVKEDDKISFLENDLLYFSLHSRSLVLWWLIVSDPIVSLESFGLVSLSCHHQVRLLLDRHYRELYSVCLQLTGTSSNSLLSFDLNCSLQYTKE